jgi:hypothetical protein
MTLLVYPYRRDPVTGEPHRLDLEPGSVQNDLGGVESWRTEVYAGLEARQLGLLLLPQLAERDLFAEGDELEALTRETEALLQQAAAIEVRLGGHMSGSVGFRLRNVLAAIGRARVESGAVCGVYIG